MESEEEIINPRHINIQEKDDVIDGIFHAINEKFKNHKDMSKKERREVMTKITILILI